MSILQEITEVRNTLNRAIERATPLEPIIQSPAEPGWQLAYVERAGTCLSLWVRWPNNLDARQAMRVNRQPIDLSDSEWDNIVLAETAQA